MNNQALQQIINLANAGKNPQQLMYMLMQKNPNMQLSLKRLNNMAQGRNPREFIMQLAKQKGISEQQMQDIQRLLNI